MLKVAGASAVARFTVVGFVASLIGFQVGRHMSGSPRMTETTSSIVRSHPDPVTRLLLEQEKRRQSRGLLDPRR
jgi:hypothetical protein